MKFKNNNILKALLIAILTYFLLIFSLPPLNLNRKDSIIKVNNSNNSPCDNQKGWYINTRNNFKIDNNLNLIYVSCFKDFNVNNTSIRFNTNYIALEPSGIKKSSDFKDISIRVLGSPFNISVSDLDYKVFDLSDNQLNNNELPFIINFDKRLTNRNLIDKSKPNEINSRHFKMHDSLLSSINNTLYVTEVTYTYKNNIINLRDLVKVFKKTLTSISPSFDMKKQPIIEKFNLNIDNVEITNTSVRFRVQSTIKLSKIGANLKDIFKSLKPDGKSLRTTISMDFFPLEGTKREIHKLFYLNYVFENNDVSDDDYHISDDGFQINVNKTIDLTNQIVEKGDQSLIFKILDLLIESNENKVKWIGYMSLRAFDPQLSITNRQNIIHALTDNFYNSDIVKKNKRRVSITINKNINPSQFDIISYTRYGNSSAQNRSNRSLFLKWQTNNKDSFHTKNPTDLKVFNVLTYKIDNTKDFLDASIIKKLELGYKINDQYIEIDFNTNISSLANNVKLITAQPPKDLGLIIGLSIGFPIGILLITIIIFIIIRKYRIKYTKVSQKYENSEEN